ncbi:MAG TPA: HAMP domain-containing sensor histidine kinase [Myxococcales bacterium]|nr:HAMP domain-containing sensor histidine kinase [Myxococcales bacterium]
MRAPRDNKPDEIVGAASLLRKYESLCVKYGALVRRLEARMEKRIAVQHLGRWGLKATTAALALVEHNRIRLANRRFYELAVESRWATEGDEPNPGQQGVLLRSIILEHANALMRQRLTTASIRLAEVGGEKVLRLRIERGQGDHSVLALIEDVTQQERLEREMHRSHEALLQQERLHMLGEVAGSIAHDLRTTLRSMGLHLERLRREEVPNEEAAEALRRLDECVRVASATVAPLHDFARAGSLETTAVRLDRVVRQSAALVEMEARTLGMPMTVEIDVPGKPVRASEAELSHLFLNLFNNARDAMIPKGGKVKVIGRVHGETMRVVVSDQGSGIKPEHLPHVFEAFFTTKGSRGTGLGLWLVANTVNRLGGTIEARPQKRGAAFVLTLPLEKVSRSQDPRSSARGESSPPAARRNRRAPRTG